jgi:hypothetical protein
MVIKYTNIYHSKALQHLPKFGIFGLRTNHLATLVTPDEVAAMKKKIASAFTTPWLVS